MTKAEIIRDGEKAILIGDEMSYQKWVSRDRNLKRDCEQAMQGVVVPRAIEEEWSAPDAIINVNKRIADAVASIVGATVEYYCGDIVNSPNVVH